MATPGWLPVHAHRTLLLPKCCAWTQIFVEFIAGRRGPCACRRPG